MLSKPIYLRPFFLLFIKMEVINADSKDDGHDDYD